MTNTDVDELMSIANRIRKEVLVSTNRAQSGHPGGSLSAADIMTVLFFRFLRHDPANLKWENRDRFVLSKGHSCPLLYSILSELGYFEKKELENLRQINCLLQGHPHTKIPGIEIATGSLGQGLSAGVGMAIAGKLDRNKYKVYVLIGDGETQEGQIWEAAMSASHFKLDNLVVILDKNGLQIDGLTKDVMGIEPIADKWRAFGWKVIEIDGHNFEQMISVFETIQFAGNSKPTIIIADTIKGKDVSFMENVADYHGKALTNDELQKALSELEGLA